MSVINMAKLGAMAMPKPKEFVKRLMVAECDKGSMDYQYLNLPKDHGVYVNDTEQPLMNALDYKADRHVLQFGRCTAPGNPKNMIGEVVNKVFPLSIFSAMDKLKGAMGCDGCKCSPKTLKVWQETNEGNCLDGANGILNTSHLVCCYGGKITITEIPQEGEGSDSSEGENSKKTVAERMPQEMAEQLNRMNSESTSDTFINDMDDWYAGVEDFEQNYGVSRERILSNYANNKCMNIPRTALNEDGYLCGTEELTNFCMGGASVALIGGACVSAFNTLQALGAKEELADIVMAAELQQTVSGFMDQGPVAAGMVSTGRMLKSLGMETKMVCKASKMKFDKDSVAILGTSKKDGKVSYHTLKADENGKVFCVENKAREMRILLKEEKDTTKMMMQVKRKKQI